MNACKLKWCTATKTYVADDGIETIVDDEWFDGEESLDLEVKCEYVEEMVGKEEAEWGSDDDLAPYDEGDEAVMLEGTLSSPLQARTRRQNPNVCQIAGHSTSRMMGGQSRSIPCGLTPTPALVSLPPSSSSIKPLTPPSPAS
jgi:hypothetical protein